MGSHRDGDERAHRTPWDDGERTEMRGNVSWLLRFVALILLCGFAVEALLAWWASSAL